MAVYTAIDDAGSNFNTVLYTSTGSTMNITGAGFQPDIVWIKARDEVIEHVLFDAVRGATKYIKVDTSTGSTTAADSLTSFDSDGYTIDTAAYLNNATKLYASWNWKMGTTTGIDTTGSTITPTAYSLNAAAGQSIITYTGNGVAGALVPHGLGVAPDMIITKRLDTTSNWLVYTADMGNTYAGFLDTTAVFSTDTGFWNNTSPTSVLFSLGTYAGVNENTGTYVAYCFTNTQGFSNFGRYEGNGDTNGTVVFTGFRPAFFIVKRSDSTGNWMMYDDKREGYNPDNDRLVPNETLAEASSAIDILSTGFKLRSTDTYLNVSGGDYFYMAFADAPFVNSSGVPVNAR